MKSIKWISNNMIALLIGAGLGSGALAVAAPGDQTYEAPEETIEITQAQAATAANWFISVDAWSGANSDVLRCEVLRDAASSTGFRATCHGLKSAAPGNLPVTDDGVRVVGVVE